MREMRVIASLFFLPEILKCVIITLSTFELWEITMISNQIIQTSIDELKAVTKVDIGVYDPDGQPVAFKIGRAHV